MIDQLISEGAKDRAVYSTADAQAAAVSRAAGKNTPAGAPRDLSNLHAGLTPLPEFASTTDDGSQALPPKPWQPGMPIPARQMPDRNSDSTRDNC